jgi:GGDEF domain-containing protein
MDRLTRAARAAQTLSEVLWEALHEELNASQPNAPREQRVAELSERLSDVSTAVASLARGDARPSGHTAQRAGSSAPRATAGGLDGLEMASGPPAASAERWPAEPGSGSSGSRVARATYGEPSAGEPPPSQESFSARDPAAAQGPAPSAAVLVDELAPREPVEPAPAPGEPVEIEIRDERGEHGPSAWIASIGRRLERYERDGVPFAVLLVELVDVERLRHAELPGEVARLTGLVETALARELRPADSLTRESPGRYWLLAPETDSASARTLAERLASAVRSAVGNRGAPLEVAVGVAGCPADGDQAAALAAHADIALYAALAAGRPVV